MARSLVLRASSSPGADRGLRPARPFNCSGPVGGIGTPSASVQDISDFLQAYFANDPRADVDRVGGVSVQDIFEFLTDYFEGC